MSQQDTLRQMDAMMLSAFTDAGMCDVGTYTAPGGSPVPCTVLIDSDMQILGDVAQVNDRSKTITIFNVDVATPVRNGVIVVASGTYKLVSPTTINDESRSVWVARHE